MSTFLHDFEGDTSFLETLVLPAHSDV